MHRLSLPTTLALATVLAACTSDTEESLEDTAETGLTRNETSYVVASTLPFSARAARARGLPWDGRVAVATEDSRGASRPTLVLDGGALHEDVSAPKNLHIASAYDPQRQIYYEISMSAVRIITASSATAKLVDTYYGQPIDTSDPSRMFAFVDPPTGTLYRIRDLHLERMVDVPAAYANHPSAGVRSIVNWGRATGPVSPLTGFDEARGVVVSIQDSAVSEYELATSTWRQATVQIEGRDPGDLGLMPCLPPVFDTSAKRLVAFCPHATGIWFKEWDGTTLRFGRVEYPSLSNTTMVFDRASGKVVLVNNNGVSILERRQSVVANAEPILSRPEQTVFATESSRIDFGANDPDGDPVRVTFGALPAGATVDGDALVWRPTPADAGEHTIEVGLDDGESVVSRQAKVTVVSLSYALPTGSYHQSFEFGARGKTSQGGASRGASARVRCTLEGENPGVLHAFCAVNTEICSGGSQGGAWCTQTSGVGMSMRRVLDPSGTSTGDDAPRCTGPGCGHWSSQVTAAFTDRDRVCVSYSYRDWIKAASVVGEGCNR